MTYNYNMETILQKLNNSDLLEIYQDNYFFYLYSNNKIPYCFYRLLILLKTYTITNSDRINSIKISHYQRWHNLCKLIRYTIINNNLRITPKLYFFLKKIALKKTYIKDYSLSYGHKASVKSKASIGKDIIIANIKKEEKAS